MKALLLALVALLGVRTPDTARILAAIESATTDEHEAALLVVFAKHESGFLERPRPTSWDARAGLANGPWQLHGAAGRAPLATQARAWLYLLHEGARVCPEAPAAPLSGGCLAGRRIADAREVEARALLERAKEAP